MTGVPSFLQSLCDRYLLSADDFTRMAFVFPTKRAGIFFTDVMKRDSRLKKPLIMPAIYSIEEFFEHLSPYRPADDTDLVFFTYGLYSEICREAQIPLPALGEFYPWAQEMLADFNDIDYYRVDGSALLAILTEAESFRTPERENTYLQRFQHHVRIVRALYIRLSLLLHQQQCAYPGMLARTVCEGWESVQHHFDKWDTVVFAGFNALNACESFLIEQLVKIDKAVIAWDMDTWFCREEQESGYFFRTTSEHLRCFAEPDALLTTAKTVMLAGAPQRTGQAKTIGIFLERFLSEHPDIAHERIAIALADESLLFPVLYALPETVSKINISMGYPLTDTPEFSLVLSILRLFSGTDEIGWSYTAVRSICMHPLLACEAHRLFIHSCEETNRLTIHLEHINEETMPEGRIRAVFSKPATPDACIRIITDLTFYLKDKIHDDSTAYETIFTLYTVVMNFVDSYRASGLSVDVRSFCTLLIDILEAQKIPFSGEPLEGIQIMGMLETRALDFDAVFVAACNEGVLPKGKGGISIIPYDMRKSFGLPTFENRDAVFAYHFFRLLRRAKYVFLTYNNQPSDGFSSDKGEKSRFIEQIQAEIAPLGTWHITETETVFRASTSLPRPLTIKKTQSMFIRISKNPWSATALSTYISCPMQYYFRYVARMKETNELEDEASALSIGSIMHRVLESLYCKVFCENHTITADALNAIIPDIPSTVYSAYRESTHIDPHHGKNALIADTLALLCTEFVRNEAKQPPLRIQHYEKNIHVNDHPILIDDRVLRMTFTGRIDRVDTILLNGSERPRIVDYKTGSQEQVSFDLCKLDDTKTAREEFGKKRAVFQVLFYWYLLCIAGEIEPDEEYCAGIAFIRNPSSGIALCSYRSNPLLLRRDTHQILFEKVIASIIGEILNPEVPFTQTNDEKRCEFCAYRTVCMR